jgi:predicted HTH transcriptional regulator
LESPASYGPPLSLDSLTRPIRPFPTNPLIADPLFLAHYIEKVGSGTLEMADLCRAAGLRPPEFRLDMGCFILTLWRPDKSNKTEAINHRASYRQVTGQVTGQVQRLLAVCEGVLSRQELQERLGLRHRDSFQHNYLQPALEAGLIEMTIPDKPRSSKQQYRLTEKGRLLLATPASEEGTQ